MAIEFTESAGKHRYTEADAVHAMNNARYYEPEFDESRDRGVRPESDEREIHPDKGLHGRRAAEASRELLRRAGRPSIDPDPEATGATPRRQVRLPRSLNTRLDAAAAEQGRSASDIMRDAITAYLDA